MFFTFYVISSLVCSLWNSYTNKDTQCFIELFIVMCNIQAYTGLEIDLLTHLEASVSLSWTWSVLHVIIWRLIPILYEFVYPGTCFISQEGVGVELFVLTHAYFVLWSRKWNAIEFVCLIFISLDVSRLLCPVYCCRYNILNTEGVKVWLLRLMTITTFRS